MWNLKLELISEINPLFKLLINYNHSLEELDEIWMCRQEEKYRHQVGNIDPRATNHHWNTDGGKVGNTAVGVKDKFVIFFKFGEFKNHLVKICPRKFFST